MAVRRIRNKNDGSLWERFLNLVSPNRSRPNRTRPNRSRSVQPSRNTNTPEETFSLKQNRDSSRIIRSFGDESNESGIYESGRDVYRSIISSEPYSSSVAPIKMKLKIKECTIKPNFNKN